MSCENVPTTAEIAQAKDDIGDFNAFMTSTSDTFIDSNGVSRLTLQGALSNVGFSPAGFDFTTGGTLQAVDYNLAVYNPAPNGDNNWYAWGGAMPKIIPANSTPQTTGGFGPSAWSQKTDTVLRPSVLESIRRSYAEAGYTLVAGSFEQGGTLNSANDVLLHEASGKSYSGAGPFPQTVAAGTSPASGGFTDRSPASEGAVYATVADVAAGKFPVGKIVTITDRAMGLFKIVSGGTADGMGILNAGAGNTATLKVTSDTVYLDQLVNPGTTDYTAAVNYAIGISGPSSIARARIAIPPAGIEVSDTINVNKRLIFVGLGMSTTTITFNNTVPNKPLFSLTRSCYGTIFENLWLFDKTPGKSTAFKLSDSFTPPGDPVLKISFEHVFVSYFAIGAWYTSDNPLDGTTHTHCSEVRWTNCRFSNNVVSVINENIQAVNIVHTNCDFENFDNGGVVDNQFTFFKMLGGGELKFYGGSVIGRGTIMQWIYPVGGSTLFAGSRFLMDGTRFELRAGKTGKMFEELAGGSNNSTFLELNVFNCMILNAETEAIDLLTYGGKVNATFKNLKLTSGSMNIRNFPTIGRSANTNIGSEGYVCAENCGSLKYIKETSSPYGTYGENYPHEVIIKNPGLWTTNQSMSADAQGFYSHWAGGNVNSMAQGLTTRAEVGRILWNSDQTNVGMNASLKIRMPAHARPTKLVLYKHPQQFALDTSFDLYLVKDNAAWVDPLNFAEATDAVLVATSVNNAGKAGYFSYDVVLTSNIFGNQLRAGYASWLEGRIYLKKRGGNPFPGFVGVEYI